MGPIVIGWRMFLNSLEVSVEARALGEMLLYIAILANRGYLSKNNLNILVWIH